MADHAAAYDPWPLFSRLEVHVAFHDDQEIGPKMLSRVAKKTGLTPEDL